MLDAGRRSMSKGSDLTGSSEASNDVRLLATKLSTSGTEIDQPLSEANCRFGSFNELTRILRRRYHRRKPWLCSLLSLFLTSATPAE